MSMGTMLDTVGDPAQTFHGLPFDAVAAYGNGRFANFEAAKREFGHLHVLEVDVSGAGIGNAGDFETGDMAYAHAGAWAKGRFAAGVHRQSSTSRSPTTTRSSSRCTPPASSAATCASGRRTTTAGRTSARRPASRG